MSSIDEKYNWKRCSVPFCTTHQLNGFHMFPKDPEQRNKWKEKCGLDKVTSSSRICSLHFTKDDYGKKYLKDGRIPSQNLPVRHLLSFIYSTVFESN